MFNYTINKLPDSICNVFDKLTLLKACFGLKPTFSPPFSIYLWRYVNTTAPSEKQEFWFDNRDISLDTKQFNFNAPSFFCKFNKHILFTGCLLILGFLHLGLTYLALYLVSKCHRKLSPLWLALSCYKEDILPCFPSRIKLPSLNVNFSFLWHFAWLQWWTL